MAETGAGPSTHIPLRQDNEPDGNDGRRIASVLAGWSAFDDLLRHRDRQIEENIRMLAGQQHSIWHPVIGAFLDPADWMSAEERKWRRRPVYNRLMPWFVITHARMTEAQPIVTYVPGPDRKDAELAEAMDIAMKALWTEMGMVDVNDRLMAWLIAAGRAHLQPRIDPNGGELRTWEGTDLVPVVDRDEQPVLGADGEPIYRMSEGVPFGPDGNPLAVWRLTDAGFEGGELVRKGSPHTQRDGRIVTDVLSPLEVRGQWGPQPWHMKDLHFTRQYLTPEKVYDLWGVDIPPTAGPGPSRMGELERVLYGTGFFGAHEITRSGLASAPSTAGYVEVTTRWQAPCHYGDMEQTDESPGGRYTVVADNRVICDGPRPVAFPYTSPIRCFDFIRMPGRPSGTTPVEAMIPPQRAYNRTHGAIEEHVNLVSNPKAVIDRQSGLKPGQFTNRPGDAYIVTRRPSVPAVEYVAPPSLSADPYKHISMLLEEMQTMGSLAGTDAEPMSGPSGEAIKEWRFNSDRFLGPTLRRAVEEYARFIEDVQALLPVIWDTQKVISVMGDDQIARTVTIMPELFSQGHIHVRPDVESMLPEGRGERQARVYQMWKDGAFGPPLTPEARRWFHELARFPNMARTASPGGADREMAAYVVGQILQGADAASIPLFPWYDLTVHGEALDAFMKTPAFLHQSPAVQANLVRRRNMLELELSSRMQQAQQAQQAQMAAGGGEPQPGAPPGGVADSGGPTPVPFAPGPPQPPANDSLPGGRMPTAISRPSPPAIGATHA